jgi:hypothetical protein
VRTTVAFNLTEVRIFLEIIDEVKRRLRGEDEHLIVPGRHPTLSNDPFEPQIVLPQIHRYNASGHAR